MLVKSILRGAALSFLCASTGIQGCIPVAIAGASEGINYTFTQVAYRSFTRTRAQTLTACHQAMVNMQIKKLSEDKTDDDIKIQGKTPTLKIYITLTSITPKVTKVKVNAKKNFFVKDKTVAVEVLMQMASILGVK